MNVRVFKNRMAAVRHIQTMRGWDAHPLKFHLPDHPKSDNEGNAWVISCGPNLFLREDGYVR